MMRTAYLTHPDCLKHEMEIGHPESPLRIRAIEEALIHEGLMPHLDRHQAKEATMDQLLRVHDKAYVESVHASSPKSGLVHLDPDTAMNPHTLKAALHAAGAAAHAVDLVMGKRADNAFCNIRPPGHHAGKGNAAGFCIFNNVAIAAMQAMEVHGLQRVAIADFDVHHGNGTEEIFRDDPRVMLCSTFRHPYYPYAGANSGSERMINVPLPAGTSGASFRSAVETFWLPALERFKPQFMLISAGFDAHIEDQMGGFALREADYAWVTQKIKEIAAKHAGGRIVSVLEGGYALSALARSAVQHISVLTHE